MTDAAPPARSAPVLEGRTQAFIDAFLVCGQPPVQDLSPAQARAALRAAQAGAVAAPGVGSEDTAFPVGPSGRVAVRILRPAGARGALPAILFFHGGGWVMGDADTHDRLCRALAAGADAAVVSVVYTPVPEARFPVQNEEAYAALCHVAANAAALGIDPARLAVCGDSAGGNMAAAVALMAKQRGGPSLRLQLLLYPLLADLGEGGSYAAFRDGPWLTRAAVAHFLALYLPDAASRRAVTAFPLTADRAALAGLPPALVIVAEVDVLRDEGEAYARRLIEAGVEATCTRYIGTIHDFVVMNALAETAPARAATAQMIAALRRAFA